MRFLTALLALCVVGASVTGQNLINRLIATVYDPTTNDANLVFTDADSGQVTGFALPMGYRPGHLVTMDRHGDVWLDDLNAFTLRKFSGVNGQILASIPHFRRATYLVTDAQADLLVGSFDTQASPGNPGHAYVHRYSMSGQLINSVDLVTLMGPSLFVPYYVNQSLNPILTGGIPRMLISRSGSIWVIVPASAWRPLIRLNPGLGLEASFAVYYPMALLPDNTDGIWVAHMTAMGLHPPSLAGITAMGWVHLSSQGGIIEQTADPGGIGAGTFNIGAIRYDGRQFQYPNVGSTFTPLHIAVHRPGTGPMPWYQYADRVVLPGGNRYTIGFHLDGAQRLWVMRNTIEQNGPPLVPSTLFWDRMPIEPPYTSGYLEIRQGETFRNNPNFAGFYWTSYWGPASLYEYVFYTDPFGDLDMDGVPNDVELQNFSNALSPYGFSPGVRAWGSGSGPGSLFSVSYAIPTDAGLPYAAPFALGPATVSLGGGFHLPVSPLDPLVVYSLQPGAQGVSNTLGVLGVGGLTTASFMVPAVPSLSGVSFVTCLVTLDPALPMPVKTVSPAFPFSIP